jgi:putative flippase GtrA
MKIITKILPSQMIRYSFVAIINTIFSYGVYALGVYLGFIYQIASLASIILGIIFSFMTQGLLVFKGVSIASFVRYVVVWGALYLVNVWLIGWAQKIFSNLYIAGAVATLPIALMGYLLMKFFVYPPVKMDRTNL